MKASIRHSLLISLCIFASGCSKEDDPIKDSLIVEADIVNSRSAAELKAYLYLSGFDIDPAAMKYDVDVIKVAYESTYKGKPIVASGLIVLPKTSDPVGMVSFQHGTISTQAEAPSVQPSDSFQLLIAAALSSTGLIAVIPDYIGFGTSSDIFHPYFVEDATATAVIDNILAARELAETNRVNFDGKLFLAGYSQGGYATLAAQKYIEQNGLDGFNLIATFPGAGGYDVKSMQEYLFSQDQYDNPFYIAYVARSYESHYDWENGLSDFFQEPFAANIPTLFNGTNSTTVINQQLTTNIDDLISMELLTNAETDPQFEYIISAFEENSLTDWTPSTPTYMYHGDMDTTVPYSNSVVTYDTFISNGARENTIHFTTLAGTDHTTAVKPYIEDFLPKMISML
ncbi:MAG TPA: lipase family protein [Chryseosolibacter sp.]|nr:lipase family protein [Chryseosolibacter sp.]